MKRILNAFLIIYLFNSCNYFIVQEKEDKSSEIIAIVNTEKLFKEDLKNVIPQNISKDDSIVLVKSFINDWAIKQLLLHKAENNNSLEVINEINHLVNDYRESLFINNYKEMLIKQQLDTVISDVEIEDFYLKSKDNFRLNEELVKIKYLHFDNKVVSKKEFLKLFKSEEIEDLEALEKQQLSFKYFQFNDSIWTQLDKVLLKLPFSKENLLKKTKLLQKQDSIGLYLTTIKDVLVRNDIAPLSYIRPTIKQMILHKRKIELIREIEKIIVKDATKNNNFKVY
ncbi:hypothetical protein SAMN04487762_1870 [Polaribacter sp. Hel1_33_78]|jgi:hypothetical protein|uniref:hypothetical protein n=1 Tax=unclassified Polaribacter TaxID=196858 RepID=UPI00052D934E|nr:MULTISPECIES: hypothetical protein [unclassified Polaribacter]MBT3742266.1 hypothetical protein [Polaribacter sp.]KGL61204.1 hypothetical protein PHEL49_2102 [Polaribacter sp. Hel1_33_49]MBT4413333.1 hypothetical protein [Polaribacter sp.]MBT7815377.1 hypothetical protein [Polaribacter sp.]PKV64504.1 hypothetical protein ATE90_0895 [Polaribacter sp. Hel1_33_96]